MPVTNCKVASTNPKRTQIPAEQCCRSRSTPMHRRCTASFHVLGLALLFLIAGVCDAGHASGWVKEIDRVAAEGCPIHPDGLIIDVGAHSAFTFIPALEKNFSVVAVECLQREMVRLHANHHHDPRFTLLNLCASDTLGMRKFYLGDDSSTLESTAVNRKKARNEEGDRTTYVMTAPLDPLILSLGKKVCAIKIDTQGHEVYVLRGLTETITKYAPVIYMEYAPCVNWSRSQNL